MPGLQFVSLVSDVTHGEMYIQYQPRDMQLYLAQDTFRWCNGTLDNHYHDNHGFFGNIGRLKLRWSGPGSGMIF